MGKYADKYVSLPKFEGDAKLGDIVSLIASADAEIAKLQREKAELEEKLNNAKAKRDMYCIEAVRAGVDKSHLKTLSERIDQLYPAKSEPYEDRYTALVERVKVHNENIANMHKHFPSSNWATFLIDIDTQEGGK